MIVAMQGKATEEDIQQVIERMVELGFQRPPHHRRDLRPSSPASAHLDHFEVTEFKVLSGVYDAYRISSPYKLAGRNFRPEGTTVTFPNGVVVGGQQLVLMAGPCSVESRDQILTSAKQVAATGAQFLRGGAFKPRQLAIQLSRHGPGWPQASPRRLDNETGLLAVITEVMEISQIELMLPWHIGYCSRSARATCRTSTSSANSATSASPSS